MDVTVSGDREMHFCAVGDFICMRLKLHAQVFFLPWNGMEMASTYNNGESEKGRKYRCSRRERKCDVSSSQQGKTSYNMRIAHNVNRTMFAFVDEAPVGCSVGLGRELIFRGESWVS